RIVYHVLSFPTRRSSDLVCVGRGVCVGPIVDIAVLSTPSGTGVAVAIVATVGRGACIVEGVATIAVAPAGVYVLFPGEAWLQPRSEEHTYELQSRENLV